MKINFSLPGISPLFFFLFILPFGCTYPNKTDEAIERETALKNKIKSVTEFTTVFRLGGVQLKEYASRKITYNKNGFKLSVVVFFADGAIEHTISHEYDSKGNLQSVKAAKPDGGMAFSDERIYDGDNNRLNYFFYNPDGTVLYEKPAVFDKKGRMATSRIIHDGILKGIYKYKYDGMKMTENAEYDSKGNLQYTWIYKYDSEGNRTEAIQYSPENNITMKTCSEYNIVNMVIKETYYFEEAIQNIFTYEYNDKNLLSVKNQYTSSGRISMQYRYQYEFFK